MALGGNCHSPIAVLTTPQDESLCLQAALYSPDGALRVEATATFAASDAEGPARLAAQLLAQAPEGIRIHFHGAG